MVGETVAGTFAQMDREGTTTPGHWSQKQHRTELEKELRKDLTTGPRDTPHHILDNKTLGAVLDQWTAENEHLE
jgi:hypothetical protein